MQTESGGVRVASRPRFSPAQSIEEQTEWRNAVLTDSRAVIWPESEAYDGHVERVVSQSHRFIDREHYYASN
jgi:hypothetical protein